MNAILKLVPIWAWALLALVIALAGGLGYQTLELVSVRQDYADYKTGIAEAAKTASEKARETEQQRQRDIDQVRTDAANQKQWMALLLLGSVLTMKACATKPASCLPIEPPSVPALLPEAKQSETLPICSPSCEQKLMDTRESWRQRLQQVVGLDLPVGPATEQ